MATRQYLHEIIATVAANRVTRGGLALAIVFLVGSTGFALIEGWSYFDAVYMTVLTMTTVGYEEVRPLSQAGRFFNLFVMLAGAGLMLYILTVTVQTVVEDEIFRVFVRRRRMRRRIDAIKGHYILCGYGRVGREAANTFLNENLNVVIVDESETAAARADRDGLLTICNDATRNETLQQAGVQRARGLVAATGSDSENVLITLTAKAINPDLIVVARADSLENEDKLRLAGARRVVTPYRIGGRRLAFSAVKPLTSEYFDNVVDTPHVSPRITEIAVSANSSLAGASVTEFAAAHEIQVLAVSKQGGLLLPTPSDETIIEPGDRVVLVGDNEPLSLLESEV